MKKLSIYCIILVLSISCKSYKTVLYEEMTPIMFEKKISKCPVAYLPLGTLEWHSYHLPLGSDGLQLYEFFKRLAKETGGIVLPMLFVGPDKPDSTINGQEFYGMDCGLDWNGDRVYEMQQLTGSAYWLPDSVFDQIMHGIIKQLGRAGFKIIVAHGHGPSCIYIKENAPIFKDKYNVTVMNCWGDDADDLCLMCDHAAANETSIVMYVRPDLVKMKNLSKDKNIWPLGMSGKDPRVHASKKYGKSIINFEIAKMKNIILSEIKKLKNCNSGKYNAMH